MPCSLHVDLEWALLIAQVDHPASNVGMSLTTLILIVSGATILANPLLIYLKYLFPVCMR